MNYDRIILELLDRISVLEKEVAILKNNKASKPVDLDGLGLNENKINFTSDNKMMIIPKKSYTEEAIEYIESVIEKGIQEGRPYVIIVSNDVQKAIGLKNRIPLCCNAMRRTFEGRKVEIIVDTPSHNSSTYTAKYYL